MYLEIHLEEEHQGQRLRVAHRISKSVMKSAVCPENILMEAYRHLEFAMDAAKKKINAAGHGRQLP